MSLEEAATSVVGNARKTERALQSPPAKKQCREADECAPRLFPPAAQDSKSQEPSSPKKNSEKPVVHIGVTGSREGWTGAQKQQFVRLLQDVGDEIGLVFHHGDCKGVDVQAATECRAHKPRSFIETHPPTKNAQRAFFKGDDKTRAPRPYLDRNRDIVDASDEVWAFPNTDRYQARSGTWFTVKYARGQKGKRLWVILPSGQVVAGDKIIIS
jgi:hypothetical protein